jgi:hypothetical protein
VRPVAKTAAETVDSLATVQPVAKQSAHGRF